MEDNMMDLFDAKDNREIIERIGKLQTAAQAQWGKMNVSQMLAHLQVPLRCAFGELKLKRSLLGVLFGRLALKQMTSGKPWRHNMPTDPNFIVADEREFEKEKKQLIALVQRFTQSGPAAITKETHPFFGKITPQQWCALQWNHLNHHLSQFGA
jgi:hypothetical protein